MNDDTRLRDGLASRESPIAPVAVGGDGEAGLVPGSGVYAALDLGTPGRIYLASDDRPVERRADDTRSGQLA